MKALVIVSLVALSFATGFTCSKNTPEAAPAEQTQEAAPEAAPAEGTATEAAPEATPAEGANQ